SPADPRPQTPARELSDRPGVWTAEGKGKTGIGLVGNGFAPAREPRRLRPGRRNGAEALQFAREIGQGKRLVERRPHVGVSTAGSQEPARRESENARERRGARVPEHLRDRFVDAVPATPVE